MRLILIGIVLVTVQQQAFCASTPFEAIVVTEEVYVRSGPGKPTYYPTSKLKQGDRVMVRRIDPGPWYMIDPPAGSFSWIPKEFVKRRTQNRGVVTQDNFVRIGSALGVDAHDVRHPIRKGEEVEIIGERKLDTQRGPVEMYQIKPPPSEYRYIPGDSVVPADSQFYKHETQPLAQRDDQKLPLDELNPPDKRNRSKQKKSRPDNAFAIRDHATDPFESTKSNSGLKDRPLVRVPADASSQSSKNEIAKSDAVIQRGPTTAEITVERSRLDRLDARFRAIIRQETREWNFDQLKHDYQQLRQSASTPSFASQVDLRLTAVDRYQAVKKEYDDFLHLTAATDQRDAQLLALQRQQRPAGGQARNSSRPELLPKPSQRAPVNAPTPSRTAPAPQFDGAGIIQRSATTYAGAPRHVLLAPNGRVLAYLQAQPGIDLDRYLGHAMGLRGQRSYRRDLQADLLIVRELTPVRLRP